jgi:hypothetical protein
MLHDAHPFFRNIAGNAFTYRYDDTTGLVPCDNGAVQVTQSK